MNSPITCRFHTKNHAGNRPPRPAEQTTSKLLPKPQHSGSITGLTTSAHLASLLAARLNKMVAAETLAVPTLVNLQLLFSQRFFASTNVNDLIPREEDRTFITVHTVTPTKENHRFIAAQFLNSSSLIKIYWYSRRRRIWNKEMCSACCPKRKESAIHVRFFIYTFLTCVGIGYI